MTLVPYLPHESAGAATAARPRTRRIELDRVLLAASALLDRLADRVVLFRYREWVFATFGLLGGVGALLTTALTGAILIGQGVAPGLYLRMALLAGLGVVAGSWLVGQLFDYRLLLADPRRALRRPVFVSWGGALAAAGVLALLAARSGQPLLLTLDALARAILLGHAVGRLGCLSYGCCFGRPTRGPLAITYRDPQAKAVRVGRLRAVPLHPAALYEALGDLVLVVVINAIAGLGAPLGAPTALALAGYGCVRFATESLRCSDGHAVVGHLSVNHVISLALLAGGAGLGLSLMLGSGGPAPAVAWGAALSAAPALLAASVPCALIVFLGFSVHRRQIGHW